MLKLPQVGLHEDFFDLGGDSLLAVEMVARIEDVCGAKLSLSELDSEITIERVGRAITEGERQGSRSPVRPIQSSGSRLPFFFHNGDCETGGSYCRNLVRHLGPDQPFYSLMPHGFFKDPVPETIEAMAADHLRSVLAIQPKGPYVVGGFCYGGTVAFEMARQLQQQGHEVKAVVMVDSRVGNTSARPRPFDRTLIALLARVLRMGPRAEAELVERYKYFRLAFQEALGGGAWRTACFVGNKMKSFTTQGVQLLARPFNRNTSDAVAGGPPAWQVWTPTWHSHLAVDAYVPADYSGRIVLLRSTTLLQKFPDDPTAGWGRVTPDVAVEWLIGDHRSCVTKHVADLAEKMNHHLVETSGSHNQ